MPPVLLLGPHPTDPALVGFAGYLAGLGVPHTLCSDLTRIGFSCAIRRDGNAHIRLDIPDLGSFAGDEIAVFVRHAWAFSRRTGTGPEARFIDSEYYSSWWTLCAALPHIVNRPGRWAWLHEREARARLARHLPPEYWTSTHEKLPARWDDVGSAEIHLEDLVGFARCAFAQRDELAEWQASGSPSGHLRAIFAPSSRYLLQICVAGEALTVLNEIDVDVDSAGHRTFMRGITDQLQLIGLDFFGIAMVTDTIGRLYVTRILSDPPYSWYSRHAAAIHERLYAALSRRGPPGNG